MFRVRVLDAPAVPGGKALMICDADGVALPMQVAGTLDQAAGDRSMFTVKFCIDGKEIVLD